MELKRTDEFRADAVRIVLTSGLTRKQVASDLGVGLSTLNKWITAHRDADKRALGEARKRDRSKPRLVRSGHGAVAKKSDAFFVNAHLAKSVSLFAQRIQSILR